MSIELFEHNRQTYNNMVPMFENENRVGVVQPTGTGKSFLILKLIEDNPDMRTAVLSPSTEIFTQLREYAAEAEMPALPDSVDMITYQTLFHMTDDEIQSITADYIVLDEFHRVGAEQWGPAVLKLLDTNCQAKVLGASATPVRYLDNTRDMALELFDRNLAVEMTLGEAVRRGILPTPKYVPVWYDVDGKMARYEEDVSNVADPKERKALADKLAQMRRQLENAYGAEEVFEKYMPHDHGKYIVFCRDRQHLKEMQQTVPQWLREINSNVRSYVSISAQEDKDVQLQEFKVDNGEDAVKLLFTIDRLNEGVHVKGIDGVIMLRPTVSPIIYLQQMGRALAAGNESPLIFDMVNNYRNVQVPFRTGETRNVFELEFREGVGDGIDLDSFHIFEDMMAFTDVFEELENVLYPRDDMVWRKWFRDYLNFKSEFGREPAQREVYCGKKLGQWCSRQRILSQTGQLSDDRHRKLLDAGFDFSSKQSRNEKRWQKNLAAYVAFKEENDREPQVNDVYQNIKLGVWCRNQRKAYTLQKLSEAKMKKLVEMGFVFEPYEAEWRAYFEVYVSFKKEYGRNPKFNEMHLGKNLGLWCNNQRRLYKSGALSAYRQQMLLGVGFIFEAFAAQWESTLELYKLFKSEYGREPVRGDVYHGVHIGVWRYTQRYEYNLGRLPLERVQQLLDVGFSFGKFPSHACNEVDVADEKPKQSLAEQILVANDRKGSGSLPQDAKAGRVEPARDASQTCPEH